MPISASSRKNMSTPEGQDLSTLLTLIDALEDHEDVQRVSSNLDVDESVLEALA